ncbi:PSD1 and planctomycete cytochrome C domain-containing protein [Verrucomicrobiales bacterium]|nr:PSD1 and planctomycete cytochrome C domain-containing protein [Verrucomicrobiales bacterium]MDC0321984.1 PSD1 and planctomycete cytochrome C domain-containing protein [Verrucomicrobiales bacterium]
MDSAKEHHFNQLLQRSFQGELSEKETEELRELLKSEPEAVERYLEHCQAESWLRDPSLLAEPTAGKVVALSDSAQPDIEAEEVGRALFTKRNLVAAGLVACGIVALVINLYPARSVATVEDPAVEPSNVNDRDWKTLVATTGSQSHPPLTENAVPDSRAQKPIRFNRDIRPIFSETCFHCHGPDEEGRRADLRLDVAKATTKDADGFQPIVPGDPEASEVWYRIISDDEDDLMPPPKSHLAITTEQKALIKRWIEEGAEYEGHWAFDAPARVKVSEKSGNEIDFYVQKKLAEEGLKPSAEADRRTLARRLYLDLTGLPPSREEMQVFLTDTGPNEYETLVDQLLASPHYGERMAVSWMDQARYADTNGYSIDGGRHMWLWRDWVIQAFNSNMPFDQFTIEQLAGDLLPNPTESQMIATGFNRNHMITHEGGTIPAENLMNYCADRVKTTSEVFLGLTIACAQCHDHKYDPISQLDYYKFYAYFNSVGDRGNDGNAGVNSIPYIQAKSPIAHDPKPIRQQLEQAREELDRPRDKAQEAWSSAVRQEIELRGANQKLTAMEIIGAKTPNRATDWVSVENGERVRLTTANRSAYTFSARVPECDGDEIAGLRIVFEPDPETGNIGWMKEEFEGGFFVSSVLISGGDLPSDEINLYRLQEYSTVTASAWHPDHHPENVADERDQFAWTPFPEVTIQQRLTLHFEQPIKAKDLPYLTVTLSFSSGDSKAKPNARILRFEALIGNDNDSRYPSRLQKVILVDAEARTPEDQAYLAAQFRKWSPALAGLRDRISNLERRLSEMTEAHPVMVMNTAPKPRDTFILHRGDYASPGEKVSTGTPSVLPQEAGGNRLDLAKWLVDPAHPLTSRVTVNRYWQMFFGTGLVSTTADFGSQGEWPSHPELLDSLAVDFRESGWDVKAMIKKIVTSETYRQDSRITPENFERDPSNRLLARGPRFRLQAEFVRDAALKTSGLLVPWIGGASVNPGQPDNLWKEISHFGSSPATAQAHVADRGLERHRRSLYTFWKRTVPPPNMATFDAPNREFCVMQRSSTNTPLQALVLLNDPHFVTAARAFANRIMSANPAKPIKAINAAFEEATGRLPIEAERLELLSMYEEEGDFFPVAQLIMNLSETITRE